VLEHDAGLWKVRNVGDQRAKFGKSHLLALDPVSDNKRLGILANTPEDSTDEPFADLRQRCGRCAEQGWARIARLRNRSS
ncbi:hypothetical protein DKX15_19710, partial [Enterococcus faecium]